MQVCNRTQCLCCVALYLFLTSIHVQTSFADTAPVHLISEASVEKLNTKLETPLPIERFRPNIILNGCEAHDEVST